MFAGRHIAVVEDDETMGASIVQRLEIEGARVTWLRYAHRAIGALRTPAAPIDAVVCDIVLPDGDGETLFTRLAETHAPPPFLFVTGRGEIDQAVRLMRAGAADYISKPFDMSLFLRRLHLLMSDTPRAREALLGTSPQAVAIDAQLVQAAQADGPVLIMGPAGSGKGRLARQLHARSDRAAASFTVHDAGRDGPQPDLARLAQAAGEGMLHLASAERLAPGAQDALIAWLDALPADPRLIVSATPAIAALAAQGQFRGDLLDRLRRTEISIPPLAARAEDAVWMLHRLFPAVNARAGGRLRGIAALTEAAVRAHDWPGNGRELRARLIRGVEHAAGDWLFPADLFPERQTNAALQSLAEARDAAERAQIMVALERSGHQMAEAARLLKVSRTTLWEKIQKLGLQPVRISERQ